MTSGSLLQLGALFSLSLAVFACSGKNDASPFVGTYTRPGFFSGSTARLTITPGGMAMEDSGIQESIMFGGELRCDSADHCAVQGFFCSVDLARQGKDRIVITADRCDRWAGVWTLDPDAAPISPRPTASGSSGASGSTAPTSSAPPPTRTPPPPELDRITGVYERPGFMPDHPRVLTITRAGAVVEERDDSDAIRFESVTCDPAASTPDGARCRVEGPGCRADLDRGADGRLVVIGGGDCGALSGTWTPRGAAPPASAAPSAAPSASAAPSSAPSASTQSRLACSSACMDALQACMQGCVDDPRAGHDCASKCNGPMSTCMSRCK